MKAWKNTVRIKHLRVTTHSQYRLVKDLMQTIGDKSYQRNLEQTDIYWGGQAK